MMTKLLFQGRFTALQNHSFIHVTSTDSVECINKIEGVGGCFLNDTFKQKLHIPFYAQ